MNWSEVGQIVLCAVGSGGGIGAIIVCTVKWSSNKIADRLSKKYELKLQKEMELIFLKTCESIYQNSMLSNNEHNKGWINYERA